MKISLLLSVSVCAVLGACASTEDSVASRSIGGAGGPVPASFDGAKLDAASFAHYGAGVHQGAATPIDEILASPETYGGVPVRVEGPIESVCQMKGCWVKVGSPAENMLVRFKDYGFFLPLDATGEIVLEGDVKVEEISVEMRKHYLEDAGKPEEAAKITEPETKVTFVAVGAAIKKG